MERASTGTILRCAAACASRGRPRRRGLCCFASATEASPDTAPSPHTSLAARRASALASPPPRPHAELGTRLLDVRGAPHAPLLPSRLLTSPDLKSPQWDDATALMVAAIYGHEGCVRLLLESKASVNATNVSLERAPPPSTCAMDQLHRTDPLALVHSAAMTQHCIGLHPRGSLRDHVARELLELTAQCATLLGWARHGPLVWAAPLPWRWGRGAHEQRHLSGHSAQH